MNSHDPSPLDLLRESFAVAVARADPVSVIGPNLPDPSKYRRVCVVGAGKAAASMAQAVERAWNGHAVSGTVVTRYGHRVPTHRIDVIEAAHPVPDGAGEKAARHILATAQSLTDEDLLLVLISGGGSSLMTLPAEGLTMEDLREVNQELLRSGAPIAAMNCVRKHLSSISGGRLSQASRAEVIALIISDVTGDDPADIASGPCAPDPTTFEDALNIVKAYRMSLPAAAMHFLEAGAQGHRQETPKPGDAGFAKVSNRVIATPHDSLEAAAQWFEARGINAAILGDTVTGEAVDAARVYAALVREIRRYNRPFRTPTVLLSGGECTVTLDRDASGGRGGRCTEFLLALAIELDGMAGVYALAGDTDGVDGSEDNAGAWISPTTLASARDAGLSPAQLLQQHDAYGFFAGIEDLLVTGPTFTNVNDYRAILIL